MDATNYSLTQASLEIIGLTLLLFMLGVLTCTLLRKLGLCCRKSHEDEPSLFTLKEPAAFDFEAHSTNQSASINTEAPSFATFTEATKSVATEIPAPLNPSLPSNTPSLNTQFEKQTTSRQDLVTPTLEIELPTPTPATLIKPEFPSVNIPSPLIIPEASESLAPSTSSGYVVDIDTLLRRKPDEPPAATIAAASKHQGTDTTNRNADFTSVSLADLLNTPTDLIDNLRKLEGITPRIEALLNEAGIKNYQTLAQKRPKELKQILEAAGEQFKQIDPQTWPFQAELAAKGEWTRLQDYQTYLKNNPS